MKSPSGEAVRDARNLVVVGRGYQSEEEARTQAAVWRDALEASFARLVVGADFGDRSPKGTYTDAGLRWLEQQHARRVLNDEHGTMVYRSDPQPLFASMSTEYFVGKSSDLLIEALADAVDAGASPSPQQRLAYDLFSLSFFQTSGDARFITLMMAVETLLEPQPRSERPRAHVDELIRLTRASELEQPDIDSLVGSLRSLRDESIAAAGKRLASSLGDRRFMDGAEDPVTFFSRCYSLRSRLIHGAVPRPTRDEVDHRAASLEQFVGKLLSTQLTGQPPE